tara:strand:- start:8 stop:202 length:195 start_codon:yes stop_codon:yes gene_type:complete
MWNLMIVLGILASIFWVWMLVECAVKEINNSDKVTWVIIIALTGWIGAIVYYFHRRPKRIEQKP